MNKCTLIMTIVLKKRPSTPKDKIHYSFEWGRLPGQRRATGIFTYTKPKDQQVKNHNKEAIGILDAKKSQLILDVQAINSGFILQHK
jgi:hypothetical protein